MCVAQKRVSLEPHSCDGSLVDLVDQLVGVELHFAGPAK
jgi:hypothetical protein